VSSQSGVEVILGSLCGHYRYEPKEARRMLIQKNVEGHYRTLTFDHLGEGSSVIVGAGLGMGRLVLALAGM